MVTWKMALSAVALQITGSLATIFLCSVFLGFTSAHPAGLRDLVVSSAVAIKMLSETGQLRGSRTGKIAIAILIGQDLAFLPMLLIVENIGEGTLGLWAVVQIALSVGVLVILSALSTKRRVNLPAHNVMGNVDLSPLTGLVYCFGFGAVRLLLGAVAGLRRISRGTGHRPLDPAQQMVRAIRPIQSILIMAFFLSVGLLIDLKFIAENFWTVLVVLLVVTLFKTAMNIGIMRLWAKLGSGAYLQGLRCLSSRIFVPAGHDRTGGRRHRRGRSRLVNAVTVPQFNAKPALAYQRDGVHGLTSRRIDTLQELVDAAYGDEVKVVQFDRVGLSRLSGSGAQSLRHYAATVPALARIKTQRRRTPIEKIPARPNYDASLRESGNRPNWRRDGKDSETKKDTPPSPEKPAENKKDPLTALKDQGQASAATQNLAQTNPETLGKRPGPN